MPSSAAAPDAPTRLCWLSHSPGALQWELAAPPLLLLKMAFAQHLAEAESRATPSQGHLTSTGRG